MGILGQNPTPQRHNIISLGNCGELEKPQLNYEEPSPIDPHSLGDLVLTEHNNY